MYVQNVSPVRNIAFKGAQDTKEAPEKKPSGIDNDGKKKLIFVLGALATVGAATLAIVHHKKLPKDTNVINEPVQRAGRKIEGVVRGEDLEFDSSDITKYMPDGKNKFSTKSTFGKYKAEYKGKPVIIEEKDIVANNVHVGRNFGFIKDAESGKILEIKRFDRKVERPNNPIVRTGKTLADESGNKIVETYKNGHLHSKQKTILNTDGSKQIIVEYADKGSEKYKQIIDIAADGTRNVTEIGHRMLSF